MGWCLLPKRAIKVKAGIVASAATTGLIMQQAIEASICHVENLIFFVAVSGKHFYNQIHFILLCLAYGVHLEVTVHIVFCFYESSEKF